MRLARIARKALTQVGLWLLQGLHVLVVVWCGALLVWLWVEKSLM